MERIKQPRETPWLCLGTCAPVAAQTPRHQPKQVDEDLLQDASPELSSSGQVESPAVRATAALLAEQLPDAGRCRPAGVSQSFSSSLSSTQLGFTSDMLQHVAEDQPMHGVKSVPIQMSEPARGVKLGRLPQRTA